MVTTSIWRLGAIVVGLGLVVWLQFFCFGLGFRTTGSDTETQRGLYQRQGPACEWMSLRVLWCWRCHEYWSTRTWGLSYVDRSIVMRHSVREWMLHVARLLHSDVAHLVGHIVVKLSPEWNVIRAAPRAHRIWSPCRVDPFSKNTPRRSTMTQDRSLWWVNKHKSTSRSLVDFIFIIIFVLVCPSKVLSLSLGWLARLLYSWDSFRLVYFPDQFLSLPSCCLFLSEALVSLCFEMSSDSLGFLLTCWVWISRVALRWLLDALIVAFDQTKYSFVPFDIV